MYSPLHRAHRRAGFTLVELMTGVGIASVLGALLLATLPGIMRRANDGKCIGNLHTIYAASSAYVADYGFWPSFNRENPPNPQVYGTHPWFYSLLMCGYIPSRTVTRDGVACLYSDALICPANKENPGSRYQWTSAPYPWRANYTSTGYWGDNAGTPQVIPGGRDRIRPSVVTNPNAIYLIDCNNSSIVGYPAKGADWNNSSCFIPKIHGGGANALLANGAVIRVSPQTDPDLTKAKSWDPRYTE